jgi:AP-1 complex subunit gamma-1
MRQFVLTALIKLTGRSTTNSGQRSRIVSILGSFGSNTDLETQQRAIEFINLFKQHSLSAGVLERMPPPELKATVIGTGKMISP